MFKKALIILSLSSVVVVPSLATQVQGAALPTQEKATTYASNKKIRNLGVAYLTYSSRMGYR
ncbi:hypothetical protein ACFVS2_33890 [Brevibacillus sp. NPDC058079]|uniref:hypothetical protein n=1 Tax=Brevibacillus sp. NPDC058079 TaxID=3346330 RepID=UPI0036EDD4EC